MTNRVCSVGGCDRAHYARGWCNTHYARWHRAGGVDIVRSRVRGVCSVEGCNADHDSHGWCSSHYQRFRRHGDPQSGMYRDPNRSEVCCISGCEGRNVGRGWCRKHYLRWRKHGDPLAAAYPMDLSCLVCDHEDGDMVTESATGAGQRLNVSRGTVEKHRKADHDNNPEWHAKRAAWWASELSALTATQEQTA